MTTLERKIELFSKLNFGLTMTFSKKRILISTNYKNIESKDFDIEKSLDLLYNELSNIQLPTLKKYSKNWNPNDKYYDKYFKTRIIELENFIKEYQKIIIKEN